MKKVVYISYSWEDWELANIIDEFLKAQYLVVKRDVRDLKYGGDIDQFAKEMRNGNYVLCVVSVAYIKSERCMYEIVQLFKDDNFIKEKFCSVLLDTATEEVKLTPEAIEGYAEYWKEQIEKQNQLINSISDNSDKSEQIKHLSKLEEIKRTLRPFLFSLRNNIYIQSSNIFKEGSNALDRVFEKIQLRSMEREEQILDNKIVNRTLVREKDIHKSGKSYLYTWGTGEAYIQAFIPAHYSKKICCHIDTVRMSNNNGIYTMNEENMIDCLFSEIREWGDLSKRKWCKQYTDGCWMLILPNLRLEVTYNEIKDLALIIDDLYGEYQKALDGIEEKLGIKGFQYDNYEEVKLLELDKECWHKVYHFMRLHTCDRELTEWNIFNVNLKPNKIQIIRNDNDSHYRNGVSEGVHAQLIVKEKPFYSDVVEIYWKPGFVFCAFDEMDYFDNDILWKADYTYEWLVEELIPKAVFEELPFHKKIYYENYKSEKFLKNYIY